VNFKEFIVLLLLFYPSQSIFFFNSVFIKNFFKFSCLETKVADPDQDPDLVGSGPVWLDPDLDLGLNK
jgi:hypothetical protein